jgi:3-oxoacyl-[acyl-carrier-protein] synthase III
MRHNKAPQTTSNTIHNNAARASLAMGRRRASSFLAFYSSGIGCCLLISSSELLVTTAISIPTPPAQKTADSKFAWVRPVYIRSVGAFLPNDPVPNDEIEHHIGTIHSHRSAAIREKILSYNGIKNRHYAMKRNVPTHLNADLAAEAVHDALRQSAGVSLDQVGMLATGTSVPDVLVPGFANLLHGRLHGTTSMDCLTSAGVCLASTTALKAAANAVTLGEHRRALVVGSETFSHGLSSAQFQGYDTDAEDILDPKDAFKAEFLRYMLSDGAGCVLLDGEPHPTQLSFRIERFYHHSFAHELPPCMVMGTRSPGIPIQLPDIYKFNHHRHPNNQSNNHLLLQQDTQLLNKNIIRRFKESMTLAVSQGFLGGRAVDWVVPHLSSHFFFRQTARAVQDILGVPKERIWTNLSSVGNVGAASTMLLLWGLLHGDDRPGDIKMGDRVLLMVPESGNFSYQYVLLTVVGPSG